MRRFYLAAAAGVLMSGFPGMPVLAQGNVLVPQDYAPPAESTENPSAAQSAPAPETTLPQLDPNEEDLPILTSPSMSPMPPAVALDHDPSKATQVVKMMAMESPDNPGDEELPENVKISMKDYLWGPQDIDMVNRTFHIPADKVSKVCRLSLTGMLQSDSEQGYYPFDMGATLSDVTLYYDGKPSGISIITRAMCNAGPLPPNAGLILQVGDKYTAFVTQTQCPPPPPNAQTLTFKYAGNGKTDCVYR